ncbi:hypothetical protein KKF32_05175 [Patescibacteria group bacterium]|nr:hypothetical protein [Patescibacteria group bacterium]
MAVEKAWVVTARGIGRVDYSKQIEHSVEPTTRSYQGDYNYWEAVTLTAEDDTEVEISVTTGKVDIIYDYYVTTPTSVLLDLHVETINDSTPGSVVHKFGYGTIHAYLPKGFAFLQTIKLTIHNYGDEDISGYIGIAGVEVDEDQYYMTL